MGPLGPLLTYIVFPLSPEQRSVTSEIAFASKLY
jgi:hypothetical protein